MRLLFLLLLTPPIVIMLSCSSLTRRDDVIDTKEDTRLITYLKAKQSTDQKQACELFSSLSRESEFSLQDLALIKARSLCQNTSELAAVSDSLTQQSPWLQAANAERSLNEALRSKNPHQLATAYRQVAMIQDRANEKLLTLQRAQKEANKTTDQDLQKDIEQRIYRIAPRFIANPDKKDLARVAQDFIYNREFVRGRTILNKIINDKNSTLEEQYQARRNKRNSFKTEQNKELHLAESKNFVNWVGNKVSVARYNEAAMLYARALWTEGQTESAKKVLASAEKKIKGKHPLDELEFIRGRMAEEVGNFEAALVHYEKAKTESKDKSLTHFRILFSYAWSLRKLGRFADAAKLFEQLKNETEDPFDRNRYSFWWAKSLQQNNQKSDAEDIFADLTKEDLLGFYGLLSHLELNKDLPPLKIEYSNRIPNSIPSSVSLMIRALTFTQEYDVLERYLQFHTAKLKTDDDPEVWVYFLKAYARAGLYLPLFTQLGLLQAEFKNQLLKEHPDLLFPRKYTEIIQSSAEKSGIQPELMLSIIRQESAFNPFARSPADAFGLMQILPSVAKNFEKKLGLKISHHEDLYKPEINIPIGAELLSHLQKKYKGQILLAAAAYNANEKAIENWLKTRLKEDPLEFIEDIPYDETRAYVKLVLRNFIFYSRLASPEKSFPFPKWTLENMAESKKSANDVAANE